MVYPSCSEITGSDWGQRLLSPIEGKRYPLSGSIDLTERCNLNCAHCYINQPAGSKLALKREMTTAQVLSVLDQIADAGTLFLMLTGGEILLRPDFTQIYQHAKQRGLILTLFTNATLINDDIAHILTIWPPTIIEISLYGATAGTYEKITGVKGSFNRCISGIETLLACGLNVMLKSILVKANLHELPQMRALAEAYNVRFRYDATIWPRLDGNRAPYTNRLTVEEQLALDQEDPERQQSWIEVAEKSSSQFVRSKFIFNCGAGFRSFHIDSTGNLNMCIMLRKPAYNILEMGFNEAWEKLGLERLRERHLGTKCETCSMGALCAQCPGWSQVVHGDLETPVNFICELAQERAKLFKFHGKIHNNEERIIYAPKNL